MKQYQAIGPGALAIPGGIALTLEELIKMGLIGTGTALGASEIAKLTDQGISTKDYLALQAITNAARTTGNFYSQIPKNWAREAMNDLNWHTYYPTNNGLSLSPYAWTRIPGGYAKIDPRTVEPIVNIDKVAINKLPYNLPVSTVIDKLTMAPQVVALPLEGDFYMSKKNQPAKPAGSSAAQPAGNTPTPSQPDKDPDKRNWRDKIKGSWNNSWKGIGNRWQSIGEYSADMTAKIIGYGIPTAVTGAGGYYLGKVLGFWGNDQVTEKPEPIQKAVPQQENSELQYRDAEEAWVKFQDSIKKEGFNPPSNTTN